MQETKSLRKPVLLLHLLCSFAVPAEASSCRRWIFVADTPASRLSVLAARQEVRIELGLTADQAERMSKLDQLPQPSGIRDLIAAYNNAAREFPPYSRRKAMDAVFRVCNFLESHQMRGELRGILSSQQHCRFLQLLVQVYGPREVLEWPQVVKLISLSTRQQEEMGQIVDRYSREASPTRKALGRYAISGQAYTTDTEDQRDSKARQLADDLKSISSAMDRALLGVLNHEQRGALREFEGDGLQMEWTEESVFE